MSTSNSTTQIGFVGLGAMGAGMAKSLLRAGFSVAGYDLSAAALQSLEAAGGRAATSPADAAKGAKLLVVMVANSAQVEAVLSGDNGALGELDSGTCLMLCSTVSPAYTKQLAAALQEKDIELMDAPVSGGTVKAASGDLTIMSSGTKGAYEACETALDAMAAKVYRLGDTAGKGSAVKMINQLLAGVHIAAAAEAMALAAKVGLDTQTVFDVISDSAGASWMFKNRVPHMLEGDYTPHSALDIFVKDLGIVLDVGAEERFPLPLSASARQMFLMGSAAGFGRDDDASVVRVFEKLASIDVAAANKDKAAS